MAVRSYDYLESGGSMREGEVVMDHYIILTIIFVGETTNIYKIKDCLNGKHFILKAEAKHCAQVEYQILQMVGGTCFPSVYDLLIDEKTGYLIMEYIDGHDLYTLHENNLISKKFLPIYMTEVLKGLIVLHQHRPSIIWADSKPSNIMVDMNGRIKLIDFGSSLIRDIRVSTNTKTGTKGFAAPEQYNIEGKIDERTDIYGFGAAFYFLYKNRPPKKVKKILKKCMADKKEERYQTAAQVLYELQKYVMIL